MKFKTALLLGRVSNLPTVWTNVVVGVAFSGVGLLSGGQILFLAFACMAFSLFYLAGMYLNDVFDWQWDAQYQKTRPIPAGLTTLREVSIYAGIFTVAAFSTLLFISVDPLGSVVLGLILFCFILLYDWKHKHWPTISPILMGACRMCIYLCAASLFAPWLWHVNLIVAALTLLMYIAGITAMARSEHLSSSNKQKGVANVLSLLLLFSPYIYALALGYHITHCLLVVFFGFAWTMRAFLRARSGETACIPQAVSALLAGICLLDSAFLFALDFYGAGMVAIGAFITCLLLQKKIAAT